MRSSTIGQKQISVVPAEPIAYVIRVMKTMKTLVGLLASALIALAIFAGYLNQSIAADIPGLPLQTEKKFSGRVIDHAKLILKEGKGTLKLAIEMPKGYHLTDEAPCKFSWTSSEAKVVSFSRTPKEFDFTKATYPLELPVVAKAGSSTVTIEAELYLCEDKTKVCFLDHVRLVIPVEVAARGAKSVTATIDAQVPDKLEW